MTNKPVEKGMSDSEDTAETPPHSPANQSESEGSVSSGESALVGQSAPIKCLWDMCGDWFATLEELASHVGQSHAVAGPGGLFYCGWTGCSRGDRGFNARYKMLVHVRTHTNEKPHQCAICDKSFSRAENLKIHARSHTGERPYVCPVAGCGKAYSNSSDRFKHTRTHSVDKPYVCKVAGCPKRYTDPSSLRKHVKTYRHFSSGGARAGKGAASAFQLDIVDWEPSSAESETSPVGRYGAEESCRGDEAALPGHHCALLALPSAQQPQPQSPPSPFTATPLAWPGFLRWYLPTEPPLLPHPPTYSDQETPLDLTSPTLRLQHRV